jgi:hypothetical protein
MLEALESTSASFFTLTYSEENVPYDGCVSIDHHQRFLKRLRKRLGGRTVRFFGVGEYGDLTWRPHYHYALFNVGPEDAPVVDDAWRLGFVYPGRLTPHSAAYVASYVNKKMTGKNDDRLLRPGGDRLAPEFARMSLRPGLGAGISDEVASELLGVPGFRPGETQMPTVLRHGSKQLPLGRYLTRRIRQRIGLPASLTQGEEFALSQEVRVLREDFLRDPTARGKNFSAYLSGLDDQAALNAENRRRIWSSKKGIGL